jgi:nicotinate phosphoribosyltransferase
MPEAQPADPTLWTALLKREQLNPQVTLEFVPRTAGIFCGIERTLAILQAATVHSLHVYALDEGAPVARNEVAMRLRGRYLELALHLAEVTGVLAAASGWATAARALVTAAGSIPVIVTPPGTLFPNDTVLFEHAAVTGGCLASDSPERKGLVSRNPVLLMRDTVRAAKALDRVLAPGLPRIVQVDTFFDEADEAVRTALAFGDRLTGVLLEAESEGSEVTPDLLKRVRGQLDLAGFPRVKLYVGGAVSPEDVTLWKNENAAPDGLFAGENLAIAPPIPFRAELKESDGKPVARRGLTAGTTPNLRLKKRI